MASPRVAGDVMQLPVTMRKSCLSYFGNKNISFCVSETLRNLSFVDYSCISRQLTRRYLVCDMKIGSWVGRGPLT